MNGSRKRAVLFCYYAVHILHKIIVEVVQNALEFVLDIDADISLGFAGTGIGSDPNTYIDMKTGKRLTHAEVIDRIRRFGL